MLHNCSRMLSFDIIIISYRSSRYSLFRRLALSRTFHAFLPFQSIFSRRFMFSLVINIISLSYSLAFIDFCSLATLLISRRASSYFDFLRYRFVFRMLAILLVYTFCRLSKQFRTGWSFASYLHISSALRHSRRAHTITFECQGIVFQLSAFISNISFHYRH